jgi:hypothetical protein
MQAEQDEASTHWKLVSFFRNLRVSLTDIGAFLDQIGLLREADRNCFHVADIRRMLDISPNK